MSLKSRLGVLALAALLTLILALTQYAGRSGPRPAATVVAPAVPHVPIVKAKKKALKKTVAKNSAPPIIAAEMLDKPDEPSKKRGAKLREPGEALGGGRR